MLNELLMELDINGITYRQASLMQGVLMEQINTDYAGKLHQMKWNPYAQSVIVRDGRTYWSVRTLNREAYEQITVPLLNSEFHTVELKKLNIRAEILSRKEMGMEKKELLELLYKEDKPAYIQVDFETATAFKSGGEYLNIPVLRNVYYSLMQKYQAASEHYELFAEETLEQLTQCSRIVKYHLRSCTFPVEGIQIPAFCGRITIRIKGAAALVNFAHLLFRFGIYSGVGIKTAMGMGKISVK